MSTFDVTQFLHTTVTDPNSTRATPVPEGEWVAVASVSDDPERPAIRVTATGKYVLDVGWGIDDQTVRDATGSQFPTARQSIFLDLNDRGGLDMSKGKNVQLGRLREAIGLNVPGQPFSIPMITGRAAKVVVKHRITDEGDVFADVKGVAKL